MDKYQEIKEIIANNKDIINFAEFGNGVPDDWIVKVETRLGFELPESYKWRLRNYHGGEIMGEEIYSIYEIDFDDFPGGGDIVYMYELHQKNKSSLKNELMICSADDALFYFDMTIRNEEDDYPVFEYYRNIKYANDFIEFLKRRILE